MLSMRRRWSLLAAATLLGVLVTVVPEADAGIIQSTPSMPPEGAYTAPTICVPLGPGVCVVNPALYGFNGTTRSTDLTGESIDSSIFFSASPIKRNVKRKIFSIGSIPPHSCLGIQPTV